MLMSYATPCWSQVIHSILFFNNPGVVSNIHILAHTGASSGNANSVLTTGITTTGSTTIVVQVADNNNTSVGGSPGVLTDNNSNTWIAIRNDNNSFARNYMYYCNSPILATQPHTFTFTNTAQQPSICVVALSGCTSSALDKQVGTGGTGSSVPAGNITPTQTKEIILLGMAFFSPGSITANAPFTMLDSHNSISSLAIGGGLAYYIEGNILTQNPTFTITSSVYGVSAISLKSQ